MDSVIPIARKRRAPIPTHHNRSEVRHAVMHEIVAEFGHPPRNVHTHQHPAYVAAMLYARYTGQPKLTLEEIGILEGVSRERIRQIEAGALRKAHDVFEERLAQ